MSKVTYGDIARLLAAEGFTRLVVPKSHVLYTHDRSEASLILPIKGPRTRAFPAHVAMVRRMLADFGFMPESEVDQWIESPEHHQTAGR